MRTADPVRERAVRLAECVLALRCVHRVAQLAPGAFQRPGVRPQHLDLHGQLVDVLFRGVVEEDQRGAVGSDDLRQATA